MDSKIYAIPHTLQMNFLAFSRDALEHSGMEEATTLSTFLYFFDFLERWIVYLKENPDCDAALADMPPFYDMHSYIEVLVDEPLKNYMMHQDYAGESIAFHEDVLASLLDRCCQIDHELYIYDLSVKAQYSLSITMQSRVDATHDLLSLRLSDALPPLLSIYVNLYVVYMLTQYPELSIELMEALCQNH